MQLDSTTTTLPAKPIMPGPAPGGQYSYALIASPQGHLVPAIPVRLCHPAHPGRIAVVTAAVNPLATRSCFPAAVRDLLLLPPHSTGLTHLAPLGIELRTDLRWVVTTLLDESHNTINGEHHILAAFLAADPCCATIGQDILRHYDIGIGSGRLIIRRAGA